PLAGAPAAAAEQGLSLRSGVIQTPLLELYTSEGCSSCPPADRYLTRLEEAPDLWQSVVPVAFHVTYWDYLGWRDPFASKGFDTRQRAIAARERSGVYTPGMFLAGREWRSWRRAPQPTTGQTVGVLSATVTCDQIRVQFEGEALPDDRQPTHLEFAWLTRNTSSKVLRGENRGRTLAHAFVARSHERVPLLRSGELQTAVAATAGCASAPVIGPLVTTADGSEDTAVAVWVSDRQGRPIQAVGGFWPRLP
ncbi:MAG: DUF1223 domain-containing protein, partial [Pseudomonadota bacterium]